MGKSRNRNTVAMEHRGGFGFGLSLTLGSAVGLALISGIAAGIGTLFTKIAERLEKSENTPNL